MAQNRSVTDVILELEGKVNDILGYLKNQDMLLKSLAVRISELDNKITGSNSQVQQDKNIPQKQDINITDKKEIMMPGLKRGISLMTKTPVQQRIVYSSDQRPISMANIEISQDDGINGVKVIKVAKTNATGKWVAALEPGTYSIKIFKKETSTKSRIDYNGTITVESSKDPINLEDIAI